MRHDDTGRDAGRGGGHTLAREVADRLVAALVAGEYKLGERLPAEWDLAARYRVGRPTLREALKSLQVIGLLDVRHGEGTFVADGHGEFLATALGWSALLGQEDLRQVVEARTAIEVATAAAAARHATDDERARLRDLLDRMADPGTSDADFAAADVLFHLTIAHASGNLIFERLLTAMQSVVRAWVDRAVAGRGDEVRSLAVAQHARILRAVEAGDEQGAREAVLDHLTATARLIGVQTPPSG